MWRTIKPAHTRQCVHRNSRYPQRPKPQDCSALESANGSTDTL